MVGRFDGMKEGDLWGQDETARLNAVKGRPHPKRPGPGRVPAPRGANIPAQSRAQIAPQESERP
jgi:hypothetical protein